MNDTEHPTRSAEIARTALPAYRRAARTVPCRSCGAGIGDPCRTPSGRAATYEHDPRRAHTRGAQQIGYEEGLSDALTLLDWQVKRHGVNATPAHVREEIARQLDMVSRSNLRHEEADRG